MAKSTMRPIAELCARLRPGMRVFLHAGPSESEALREALRANPDAAAGVTFVGALVPGVNGFNYTSLAPDAVTISPFAPPASATDDERARHRCLPVHYSAFADYLRACPVDLAIAHVSKDENGFHSFGINADFAGAAMANARSRALVVNPAMPHTHGHPGISIDDADIIVDGSGPLTAFPPEQRDAPSEAIAAHVATLIRDGDTIETGLGRIPAAILGALRNHRRLKLHSGMVTDAFADLWCAGAVDRSGPGAHRVGMAIGSEPIWQLAADPRIWFCDVGITHNPALAGAIDNYVAVNSAVEVDLFGQVNGEALRGRQISGTGGSADFIRAARLSKNGRSIIALPSTARGVSRIVPGLGDFPVTQTRADADIVVTEHGCAHLRHLTVDERAEALIAIADPLHRTALADAWRERRRTI